MKIARKLAIATTFVVGASALAFAGEGSSFHETALSLFASPMTLFAADPCPPRACSVVFKTAEGGPPSEVVAIF